MTYENSSPPREMEDPLGNVKIKTDHLHQQIFSEKAKKCAEWCFDSSTNKSAQIRKFYDELVMWNDRVRPKEVDYEEVAPYVQMLCAKVAYSKARKLVNGKFLRLVEHVINQVDDKTTLKRAKLFFEAFVGYQKEVEEEHKKDNNSKGNNNATRQYKNH